MKLNAYLKTVPPHTLCLLYGRYLTTAEKYLREYNEMEEGDQCDFDVDRIDNQFFLSCETSANGAFLEQIT